MTQENKTNQRIRAHAFGSNEFFMRHHNGEGEINELDPNQLGDFNFTLETTTQEGRGTIRFKGSFDPFTKHYFRHKNFRIVFEKQPPSSSPDLAQFMLDSTFFWETGQSDIFGEAQNSDSFEASNPTLAGQYSP